ncbi:hypothetical protein [Polaromonas sp. C04]|uniref:hypothetical protein n=1 Tax=Polaromonas sp. C04 TaxID=1945857 RepID=UPI000985EC19|nr:hypothetical protein [Polaromonas sp. C04]OOG57455.1 hypothetical protein B0E49_05080 [Polaromonas sp. C04]
MTYIDPRLQAIVKITNPDPTGKPLIAGAWRGQKAGPLHGVLSETVRTSEAMLRSAHDIRQSRHYGPAEMGQRLREVAGPTLVALNAATAKLKAQKESVRAQVSMLNPVKNYKDCGHWQATHDLRLIDWLAALPAGKRAGVLHEMREMPLVRLELAEALLRVPREICGIPDDLRAEIKLGLIKAQKPAEFEMLDTQLDQLKTTERALRLAVDATRETVGLSDIHTLAPDALAFSMAAEDPVAWLEPKPRQDVNFTPASAPAPAPAGE